MSLTPTGDQGSSQGSATSKACGFMFNGNEESEANLIFLIGLTSTKATLNAYINKYYIRKEKS